MKRRAFITLLSGAAAWPLVARAQQPERVRRVGVLMAGANDADGRARLGAFRQGLHELGWQEGQNVVIDLRWGDGETDGIRRAAAELAGPGPEVLVVNGNRGLAALSHETSTIPIVFAGLTDPVEAGFIASLARPAGNITGFANSELSMIGKHLEMLKQVAPHLARAAILMNAGNPDHIARARAFAAALPFGIKAEIMPFAHAADIEQGIATFGREGDGGLVVPGDAGVVTYRDLIIALAARHRLPAIYPFRVMAMSGGLLFYGADIVDLTRRAASYVDRILKGEKAGDLPVQFATKFELVINLRTAKALGVEIPSTLLALADEVIE